MGTSKELAGLVQRIAAGLADNGTEGVKREALQACETAAVILGAEPGKPLMVPASQALAPPAAATAVVNAAGTTGQQGGPPDLLDMAIARLSSELSAEDRLELEAATDDVPRLNIPLIQVPG